MRVLLAGITAAAIQLVGASRPLHAQQLSYPPAGARVRVTLRPPQHDQPIVGTLARLGRDSIVVRSVDAGSLAYPTSRVRWLEVSRGRRGHALLGGVMGGIGGAAIGIGLAAAACGDGCVGATTLGLVPVGTTLVGAALGALTGSLIHSERWERAPVPTVSLRSIRHGARRSVGVSLSLSFQVRVP